MFGCSEKFSYLCNKVKGDPSPLAQRKFNNQICNQMKEKTFKAVYGYSANLAAYYCMAMGINFVFVGNKVYYEEQEIINVQSRVIEQSYGRAKEEEFSAGSFTEDYVRNQI